MFELTSFPCNVIIFFFSSIVIQDFIGYRFKFSIEHLFLFDLLKFISSCTVVIFTTPQSHESAVCSYNNEN